MSIRKVNLKQEIKYVSLADDAIDKEKSNMDEYVKDHDIKHLTYLEGKEPSFFILKNLSASQYTDLITEFMDFDLKTQEMKYKEGVNLMTMAFKAFEMGCSELEEESKRSKITYDELDMDVIQEVSTVITNLAQLNKKEKK